MLMVILVVEVVAVVSVETVPAVLACVLESLVEKSVGRQWVLEVQCVEAAVAAVRKCLVKSLLSLCLVSLHWCYCYY